MSGIWWEKTVEYLFVKNHIPSKALFIPLDGKHELAGDGFIFSKCKWLLVEFKARAEDIKSERKKFKNFEKCKEELEGFPLHHFLVYGNEKLNREITLSACTYWNGTPIYEVDCIFNSGTSPNLFTQYLKKLISHKHKSSTQKETLDYSSVVGLYHNGNANEVITCMSVSDYIKLTEKKLLTEVRTEKPGDMKNGRVTELSSINKMKRSQDGSTLKFYNDDN